MIRSVIHWTSIVLSLVVVIRTARAQPVIIEAEADPRLEQLPILFHHGFNDDGRLWAIGPDGTGSATPAEYWEDLEVRTTTGQVLQTGIPTYVVQYWAQSDAPGFTDGDPNATADEGWAALKSPSEIRTPGENYNSPDPITYFMDNRGELFEVIPECEVSVTGVACTFPAAEFLVEVRSRFVESNYNRNGLVEHHSQDLADLFGHFLATDERFFGLRQVNMITHSAGGLDTRATLHRLNQSPDQRIRETVANVIYTAPPFGGSTAAIFAERLYSENLNASVFSDPWLSGGAGDLSLSELLVALARSFAGPDAEAVVQFLIDATPKPFGFYPGDVTINEIAADDQLATAAVLFIHGMRDLVTGLIGFPGEPKVSVDLMPEGAVANLNRYQPNYHTKQFVTWGEGGGRINLTLPLEAARSAYTTDGSCCEDFLDPSALSRPADDWALSVASARVLASELGGVDELKGYANLWHGNINTAMETVGMDWAETLISPVTALELTGPVATADHAARFYRVGPATSVRFAPDSRIVEDQFGDQATVVAQAVEYRIVTFTSDQERTYSPWILSAANASVSFGDLASGDLAVGDVDLTGERLFQLEWRSINQAGSKEAVRSASFSIDATPPSVTLIDVFTPGFEDSPEIVGSGTPGIFGSLRRSSLITQNNALSHLDVLLAQPETNWIIRNPADKILRIDFDEAGANVRYQWDEFFTDPTLKTLPNTSLAFSLADLEPGPHTLYFEVSDALGNATNAVQSVRILVDDQAPVVALNYERTGGFDLVVGPNTPIEFLAEDVETGAVSGSITVPGMPPVPVNASFRLGETTIADAAAGTGVLGTIVSMNAEVVDRVGNSTTKAFDVYYDFSPPTLALQHVGTSVLTTDGTYRTTSASVRIEVRVTDNAGYQLPGWTAGQPGTDLLRSGAPLLFESRDGRPAANGGNVQLANGMNVVVVTVSDLVGNSASLQVNIEKTETLIEDDSNRPIELISRHVDGAPTGQTGPANVATSDDGSVLIFDSSRRDLVATDTNDERDIFVWRNSNLTRANVTSDGEEAVGGGSRNPTLSGNGQYAYFASEATNLVAEATNGLNLYVKDLSSGRIRLISRATDGTPANLGAAFGRFSFLRMSATYSGRYVFFDDRFDGYVDGDANGNLDVFVADLDPDGNGDYFDSEPVIRRVSVAADGSEATGGALTGGSRYPSASRDGLYVAFQSDHTNLFVDDDNDKADAVLVRFGGVDASGTIDFSTITTIPLGIDEADNVSIWGSEHPTIDRTGRTVVFTTSANLLQSDTNQEGVDSDVYRSTGFLENWQIRDLDFASGDAAGTAVGGRIAPNHAPSVSDYTADGDPRIAYIADKTSIVDGDNNNAIDLFTDAEQLEAINWLAPSIPSTQRVLEGGITPDGAYAWWVTTEEYSSVVGAGTGQDLYRRRLDPASEEEAPQIVRSPEDLFVLLGDNVAFTVQATGLPAPSYQWLFNGEVLTDATNPTLFLSNVSFDDEGAYSVRVTNGSGEATTPAAILTVTSLTPEFVTQPENVQAAEGEPIVLTAEVAGLEPLIYQWHRNGVPITNDERVHGSSSDTLHIESAMITDTGSYVLTASNLGGTQESDAAIVTVVQSTAADHPDALPTVHALDQNYPNPFNPETTIRYALPQREHVRLEVYNVLGQRVDILVDRVEPAGRYVVRFDGRNLASGAYFYVLQAGAYRQTRTLLLTK